MAGELLTTTLPSGQSVPVQNQRKRRRTSEERADKRPAKRARIHPDPKTDARMAKNRASAHKSRIKKQRERCTLEAQVRMLSSQNRTLTSTISALTPACEERDNLQRHNQELMRQLYELKLQNQQLRTQLVLRDQQRQAPSVRVTNVHNSQPHITNSSPMVTNECPGVSGAPATQDSAVVISQQSEKGIHPVMGELVTRLLLWQMCLWKLRNQSQKSVARAMQSKKVRSSTSWKPLSKMYPQRTHTLYSPTWAPSRRPASQSPRQSSTKCHGPEVLSALRSHLLRLHAETSQLLMAGQLLHVAIYMLFQQWRQREQAARPPGQGKS